MGKQTKLMKSEKITKSVNDFIKVNNTEFEFHYFPANLKLQFKKQINESQNLKDKIVNVPYQTDLTITFDAYFSAEKELVLQEGDKNKNLLTGIEFGTAALNNLFTSGAARETYNVVTQAVSVVSGVVDLATGVASLFSDSIKSTQVLNDVYKKLYELLKAMNTPTPIELGGSFQNIFSLGYSNLFLIKDYNIEWISVNDDLTPILAKTSLTLINVQKSNIIVNGSKSI